MYKQDGERIFLPRNASLSRLHNLSKLLSTVLESKSATRSIEESSQMQKEFFKRISEYFHGVMHYEDPDLQRKARSVIPLAQLEIAAITKMRDLQKYLNHIYIACNKIHDYLLIFFASTELISLTMQQKLPLQFNLRQN